MAKLVVLDEIPITLCFPNDLPAAQSDELGLLLRRTEFMNRLRRAIRTVVRAQPG